jgi:uncharacterized membrane protein YfcA
MVVDILLLSLSLIACAFVVDFIRLALRRGQLALSVEAAALGVVTDFFDTLGIGSFAPTTAWIKFRRLVPDGHIPATLNVGHGLPSVAEALIFITLVSVDPFLLAACIASAVAGSLLGASLVVRFPVRAVQGIVGTALVIAAALYAMKNLGLMPAGGDALLLPPLYAGIAVVAHFFLGALMTFGIGLFAPSLILLSLMGLNPVAAFPIMMGACAFLMPISGFRFMRTERIDFRVVLGLTVGGIPAVLVAAYVVKSLPLVTLRWGVVVVVLYAAVLLLRSAFSHASAPLPAPTAAQQNEMQSRP